MKGKGKIKGWFTRNGVHIPIYEDYTIRKGAEPENVKAKFKVNNKFSKFKVTDDGLVQGAPYGGGSNRAEVEADLQKQVVEAQATGYEIINRPYQTKGRSGTYYDWEERDIEVPMKSSHRGEFKPTKASNLGNHIENVKKQYSDIIVMPYKPILPYTTKGRRGFKTVYKATYVVMARRHK